MYCHGYQVLFQMPGIQQLAALQLQMHGMYAAAPVLDAPACCAGAVCVNKLPITGTATQHIWNSRSDLFP